jgi:hypothetical protein
MTVLVALLGALLLVGQGSADRGGCGAERVELRTSHDCVWALLAIWSVSGWIRRWGLGLCDVESGYS